MTEVIKMSEIKLEIIPAVKVAKLLDVYPELEPVLIELSPAFKKLQNPMLRKTVAKITTLNQAAKIGKIPINELINTLREAAGQPALEMNLNEDAFSGAPPAWMKTIQVAKKLDGRPLLDAGEFPLTNVLDELSGLNPGESFEFLAPFLPVPMIDKIKKKGYQCWAIEDKMNDKYQVYFRKPLEGESV